MTTKIDAIKARLSIPAFAAPMFLISGPDLVIEACKAGVIGAFPTLNARPVEVLEEWFKRITTELAAAEQENPGKVAPWAANLIVHRSNKRYGPDLNLILKYKPDIVITSLGSPEKVAARVHEYGGLVFSDVNNVEFAHKAANRGADGLILICEGAGGHTGSMSADTFIPLVRKFFKGPLIVGGAISTGTDIKHTIKAGADFAYMGTRFIATNECQASDAYKQMVVDAEADDVVLTPYFTGIPAHFLMPSILAAGIDAFDLDKPRGKISFDEEDNMGSTWKDIWSAGKGVEDIHKVKPVAELVAELKQAYKS
ncbi:MAG: nitronate monooxygenase [Gammaproteobacteria bacterium]|nr:nitronate monooxygenase [Gammaproteobacteria bacterium]MCP4091022.1 nitronate monooxygenase [Gammaproteobacteria bacterium]MCP4277452.1 nitronate monooxygenase [Gammaproteobacteria bacterium]MCP4831487.1 nitronate monooxygenase [Gammaproteobacteria bacterium]MCP4927710.1 nitronate monooxygenase [Gammaproteobacteria bacterium]